MSTESRKAMIPEMKGSVQMPELLPQLDNPSPEPQNHKDASQTKAAEEEEEEEGEVAEATLGSVPEDAVKRQVSFKSQGSTKQKGQESVKLRRTIFQVVKAGEEYEEEEEQELDKSTEKVDTEEGPPEPETLVESNGRTVVEVTKGVAEQDKKADTSNEVRRISRLQVPGIPVDDPQPVGRRSPSPAKNVATNIIDIHRLAIPYTLGQLKELLSQTGTIIDDGFWIDKIKSHCLVGFNSVDEAVATRRALHGKRWPLSNPNVLCIEYSTQEEFDMFKNAKDGVLPKPLIKPEEVPEKKNEERARHLMDHPKDTAAKDQEKKEVAKPPARDAARPRAQERSPPVKIRQWRYRSRDRSREEDEMAVRRATGSPEREKEAKDASVEERRKKQGASSQEHTKKKEEKDTVCIPSTSKQTKSKQHLYTEEKDESKLSKTTSSSSSDASLEDIVPFAVLPAIPTEIQEIILLKTFKMELENSRLSSKSWQLKSDVIIARLASVCTEWRIIVTANYFRNLINPFFQNMVATSLQLEVLTKSAIRKKVYGLTVLNNDVYMLCTTPHSEQHIVHVSDIRDVATVKYVVPLANVRPVGIASCHVTQVVYILSKLGDRASVLRLSRDDEDQFHLEPLITNLFLPNPTLSVSSTGDIIVSMQKKPGPAVICFYHTNGCFMRKFPAPGQFELLHVIAKANGHLVCVSHSVKVATRLTEIDSAGNFLFQYDSSTRSNGCALLDSHGSIIIASQLKRIDIVDEFLNPLASNHPQLPHDMIGFITLADDFQTLQNTYTPTLMEQASCHNVFCFIPGKSEILWLNYDVKKNINVFTLFHAREA